MESNKKYVIGLDFGTDSCRALVVDTYTGREMATGVSFYPRWKAGLYCDAHNNRYRQHPLDYIESMTEAVHIALSDLKEEEIASKRTGSVISAEEWFFLWTYRYGNA